MSRQSQVNSFNDGLNKDLNPLLTPNTVMTDCLNGTIVTYNGNEFALQNDLGNYKFKFGSLSDGYVPVGIKEYANTLYIISYNPIEDMVEIGSFPSMKTINKAEINTYGEHRSEKIELVIGKDNLYSKIQNNSQLTMLSSLDEDYKLNPGDGYILEKFKEDGGDVIKESDDLLLWQHTATYILTENGKLYNIDSFVEYTTERKTYIPNDFKSVKWDVPGWFALKVIPNVMSEFNCYITDINFEPNNSGTITTNAEIKLQSIWDSNIYNRRFTSTNSRIIDKVKERLGYIIEFVGGDPIDNPIENLITTYNDIYTVIHETVNVSTDKYTQVKITPYLIVDDNNTRIIYDQFTTYVNLEQRAFNSDDVKFGETVFKYYVGDKGLTLNFDLVAPVGSSISYNLKRYVEPIENADYDVNGLEYVYKDHIKEDDIVYNGQNIITLKFTDKDSYIKAKYSTDSDYKKIGKNNGVIDPNDPEYEGSNTVINQTFDKEDYYELEVFIHPEGYKIEEYKGDEDTLCKKETRIIYASEIVNYYQKQYDNYWCDEFKLNAEAFADAAQRMLVVNNPIKQLPDDKYPIYIDWEGNAKETSDNLIDGFLDKMLNATDPAEYSNSASVGYGVRWWWEKSANLFDLPKNQYKAIGRIWRGFDTSGVNESIVGTTSNNNVIDIKVDDKNYNVDVVSTSTVKIATGNISYSYPNESQIIHMYNSDYIEKVGDGEYLLKGVIVYFIDEGYKFWAGIASPKSEMRFKVEDTHTISFNGIKFIYDDNRWIADHDIYTTDIILGYSFNTPNKWFAKYEKAASTADAINREIDVPVLTVYKNDFRVSNDENERWYWSDGNWSDCWFGFSKPKLYAGERDDYSTLDISISIPRMSNDSDKYYYTIIPYCESYEYDAGKELNRSQYVMDTILTYILMIDAIKYCRNTNSQTKYYPIASLTHAPLRGVKIKVINYLISGVKYQYDETNESWLADLSEPLMNVIYGYDENVDIVLSNNTESVNLEDKIIEFNNTIQSSIANLKEFSSVNSREMFIDIKHRHDNNYPLENILSAITRGNNNKFTISETDFNGYYNTRYDSNGNEIDEGEKLSKLYSSTIYEI